MRIGMVTLGCDKNTVDNEYLAGLLARDGVDVVAADKQPDTTGADDTLDGVLINTCGFIDAAKAESVESVLGWIGHKQRMAAAGRRVRVFVAGCLTQRYREELIAQLPEVDGFMGVGEFDRVLQLLHSPADATAPVDLVRELPAVEVRAPLPRKELGPVRHYGYLKISDGCNHNCTFCAIPSFKGRLRSVPREIVLAEARLLLGRGVREINIVAQDTSDYGRDIYGPDYGIAHLLADLCALPGDFWLRLFYFYPGGITPAFIDVMASSPRIARYLDMPLQHLHPDTLRRMKRPHHGVNTVDAVARLRAAVPDLALRTTFIVGFPGETSAEFNHLYRGVADLRLRRMGAFIYSPEEGTPAHDMKPRVRKNTAKDRFDRLMTLQAAISRDMNHAMVGRDIRVLLEERGDDGRWLARSEADAPDVDGLVHVAHRDGLRAGDFADVRVTGADTYDLFAEA